jgi:hypothetical protein
MRFALLVLLLATAFIALPAAARAACPALQAAYKLQDAALPAGADVHKLKGAAAQTYVANLDLAAAKAQACMSTGTPDARADALTSISQMHYIQAWVLTHDGVTTDRAKAVTIAKASQKSIDTFTSANTDLSQQSSANLDNWSHWNDKIINTPADACLGC